MLFRHPAIDALAQDLDALRPTVEGPEPAQVADAREAIRRAAEAVSRDSRSGAVGPDVERALTLARMAVDRARRATGDADPRRASWQEALQAPLPAAAPAPAARRTASSRFPHLELESEIPDGHPAKSEIEASVVGAFAGVKGRWRVAILVQPHAPWWGIRVEGTSICWTGTLEGPEEQSPEFLAGRVREAVRLGLMQSALPRRRDRA